MAIHPAATASRVDLTRFRWFGLADGKRGIRNAGHSKPAVGTLWNTSDIWIRRTFNYTGTALKAPVLGVYLDEDAEVYLEGNLVGQLPLFIGVCGATPISAFTPGTHTWLCVAIRRWAARESIVEYWISCNP